MHGYNAQAVVTAEQIVIAAEISTESLDTANLHPMLTAAGLDDLRYDAHRAIIRDMLVSNLRPSQLGTRLGLSKQAVNDLVREYEAKGYITLEPDPADGRAKRIVATDRGWRASEIAIQSSNAVGRRWVEYVGEERYAVFEEVLREIVAASGAHDDQPHHRSSPT